MSHHNKSEPVSNRVEIKLHPVQAAFINSKATFRAFTGGRGAGKALALDTPIPTPAGWTTMGDLACGDAVVGADGRPCRVTGVTDVQHGRDCYRVVFDDGTSVVASAEHLWTATQVWTPAGESTGETRTRTTEVMARHFACRYGVAYTIASHAKTHRIVRIDRADSVPVRCIEVDSPGRLYLCGRGRVPTHNSFVGSYDLLRRAKPGRLYMIVAPTYRMLRDASYRTFADNAKMMRFSGKAVRSVGDFHIVLGNGATVLFRSADNPDSLRGPNISGCWMDEASYCSQDAFGIVSGCLREAGEMGWLTATFTPKGKQHWTYKILGKNMEAARKNAELAEAGLPPEATFDDSYEMFVAKTSENPFLPREFDGMLRSQYTSQTASQELEGTFLDVGGRMFSRTWFERRVKVPPAQARWVRAWDKAATEGGGCHTCGVLMGADYQGNYYVADVIRGQWSTFTRDNMIKNIAEQDARRFNHQVRIYIEQEPGSGGVDSFRSTVALLAGYPVFKDRPSKDKRVRAEGFASQAEARNVILIEPTSSRDWIPDYLDELEQFPEGKADQVDATSSAFNQLIKGSTSRPVLPGQNGTGVPGGTGAHGIANGGGLAAAASGSLPGAFGAPMGNSAIHSVQGAADAKLSGLLGTAAVRGASGMLGGGNPGSGGGSGFLGASGRGGFR